MSSLTWDRQTGLFSGLSVPVAGKVSKAIVQKTASVVFSLKSENRAGSSLVFNDLQSLASELAIEMADSEVFILAQRFLLVLPAHLPLPELAMDNDGEICFDWKGSDNRMLTVTLRADGRLSYAARISTYDKEHSTKRFTDAIPKQLVNWFSASRISAVEVSTNLSDFISSDGSVLRFSFERRDFYADGKPKPKAFSPEIHPDTSRLETSVCGTTNVAWTRIWELGRTIRHPKTVLAAIEVSVSKIKTTGLICEAADSEYPEHGVIVNWSADKDKQLAEKQELAANFLNVHHPP